MENRVHSTLAKSEYIERTYIEKKTYLYAVPRTATVALM